MSTDEGPRQATKFFINGEEPTRRISTEGGYKIQGTLTHRVKVVDSATGAWDWKRLADIAPGDVVPMQMRTLVANPARSRCPSSTRPTTPGTVICVSRMSSRLS